MRAIWIASVLLLAACVPIEPQQGFIIPPPETKAGLSDLAKFIAVSDGQSDASAEYMNLVTEFYECFSDVGWDELELTEQEAMAGIFWITGMSMAFVMTDREEEIESGKVSERYLYHGLLWSVEYYCHE